MKESDILHALFRGKNPPDDDCHFIAPDQLVTTDSLVEGTHFLHEWSNPKDLAEKLVEVNVSDIAASGGIPEICFLNLGLSDLSKEDKWVEEFSRALRNKLKAYRMRLVGGDTFYSKTTHLTLTVFGKCKTHWTRSGGQNGDFLYLTGQIGDSELGLQSLKENWSEKKFKAARRKHISPTSLVSFIPYLSKYNIHACMDLTDGLIQDGERLAIASKGILRIELENLPISKLAYQLLGWDSILGSGEELQLLFLTNQEMPKQLHGIQISKIGTFTKKKTEKKGQTRVQFTLKDQPYLPQKIGFSHF